MSVYLADGRKVNGVVVGSFSSAIQQNFDLIKITDAGVWPYAEIGRAEETKPGDVCLAMGFLRMPDRSSWEKESSLHVGHLVPWGAPGLLRSSCVIDGLDERGGGLFDLSGRLIGIHLSLPLSDYQTFTGPSTCHLNINVVERNWRKLAKKTRPVEEAIANCPVATVDASQDDGLPPVPSLDSPKLAAVAAKIRNATVAMITFPREPPFGCSGTIVTSDGYIATLPITNWLVALTPPCSSRTDARRRSSWAETISWISDWPRSQLRGRGPTSPWAGSPT